MFACWLLDDSLVESLSVLPLLKLDCSWCLLWPLDNHLEAFLCFALCFSRFLCSTFDGLVDVFQSYCSYCLLTLLNSSCPFTPFSWLTFDPTHLCNSFQLWKFPVSSRFHPMHSRCILLLQSVSLLILCGFVGSTSNLVTSLLNPSIVWSVSFCFNWIHGSLHVGSIHSCLCFVLCWIV